MNKFTIMIEDLKSDIKDLRSEKEKLVKERERDKSEIIRLADKLIEAEKTRDELIVHNARTTGKIIKIIRYVKEFENDL